MENVGGELSGNPEEEGGQSLNKQSSVGRMLRELSEWVEESTGLEDVGRALTGLVEEVKSLRKRIKAGDLSERSIGWGGGRASKGRTIHR